VLSLQALSDLFNRYIHSIRTAWQHRKEFDSPPRLRHEAQFLPAAIALQETPVSPAPRIAMWLLTAFALVALLWSIFGQVDIVATAKGKIVPNERVKLIQPVETGAVTAIHVTDGQKVKAGDVLIELDATAAGADTIRLENDLVDAQLQSARARALIQALDNGELLLPDVPGIDANRLRESERLLFGQWMEYRTKLERIEAEIARREAELKATGELVKKLEGTVPIAKHRAEVFKALKDKDVVSEQQFMEQEKIRIEQEADLAAHSAKFQEIEASLGEAQKQRIALIAETRRGILDSQREADMKTSQNTQELSKARQRHKLMRLLAPVDGTVQQLIAHTLGGVVTQAQQLMVLVPKDDPLEVEAFVENKDIGFVNAGQRAEVKIETFPYTKYGTIEGEVKDVSSDAIQDEKKGLVYSCRVKLAKSNIQVENKMVNLAAGMAVTVEIKTGKRRVIEYFLSPLIQYTSESLRER